MSLEIASQLGDYRILSRVGAGAYGEVYAAENVLTKRRDAIKVLPQGFNAPADEERFLREIQLQASLHHPNIAAVLGAFRTDRGPAMVMELIEGVSLSVIMREDRIPLATGLGYITAMLDGLEYAHKRGVIHRDIKPENVVVAPDGAVKLTDFGLALSMTGPRVSQFGTFAGSPTYMSPEQVLGTRPVDARSDTYSVGVVLYEMVTGRAPFEGATSFEVMEAHQRLAPRPPVQLVPITQLLNTVILKSLEKEPGRRYQTAGEFKRALRGAMAAKPVPTARSLVGLKTFVAAAAGVVLAFAGSLTAVNWHWWPVQNINPAVHVKRSKASPVEAATQPVAAPAPAEVSETAQGTEGDDPPASSPSPGTGAVPVAAKGRRVRRQPAAASVKITGNSMDDEPRLPVSCPAPEPRLQTRTEVPDPAPVGPVVASVPPNPLHGPPPEAPPKRRNPVVRAFQKVFGAKTRD